MIHASCCLTTVHTYAFGSRCCKPDMLAVSGLWPAFSKCWGTFFFTMSPTSFAIHTSHSAGVTDRCLHDAHALGRGSMVVHECSECSQHWLIQAHKAQGWFQCADPPSYSSTNFGWDKSWTTQNTLLSWAYARPRRHSESRWVHRGPCSAPPKPHTCSILEALELTTSRRLMRGEREADLHIQGFSGTNRVWLQIQSTIQEG